MATKRRSRAASTKTSNEWSAQYENLFPTYQEFVRKLHDLLAELLCLSGIDYHALESRAKSVESFREKIQRPGKGYSNPLKDLPDLGALRVIAYYPDDITRIRKLVRKEFEVDVQQSSDKVEELALDQFGYISVHEVISLKDNRNSMTEWARFKDLHAEIQIRTVLQHAWASISHKLQYKQEADVPHSLRRKLVRLSGLLELADDQFSELRSERTKLADQISSSIAEDDLSIMLDSDSVRPYLEDAQVVSNIVAHVKRIGFPPSTDNDWSRGISQIVTLCERLNIVSLSELDARLSASQKSFRVFFDAFGAKWGPDMFGDTPHWVAVVLVGIDHGRSLKADSVPWSYHEYTEDIFKAGRGAFGSKSKRRKN